MKLKTRLVIAFFTIIIIPVLMPLSDRSGGEELWDYRNDDF